MGTPTPGGLLLSGPAGCGKTGLAHLVATILQHHPQTLTHIVTVNCQDVANDSPPNIMKHLIPKVSCCIALPHSPAATCPLQYVNESHVLLHSTRYGSWPLHEIHTIKPLVAVHNQASQLLLYWPVSTALHQCHHSLVKCGHIVNE